MSEPAAQELHASLGTITAQGGVFLVLGRTDVGKSTLIQKLAWLFTAQGEAVAILDADLGQSTYGLPTTLNLVRYSPIIEPSAPELVARMFIGAVSPIGHLLQTLIGCRRLLDRAQELGIRTVLIDTTGLVEGPLAVELKLQKIDLLRPNHLLALSRRDELAPILRPCARRTDMTIYSLPVAAAVRERSSEERRANRQDKYRDYFSNLVRQRFELTRVGVWGRVPQRSSDDVIGLLVGLNDGEGFCLGVGQLQQYTPRDVTVLTPLAATRKVKLLRFGSVAIDAQGNERFFSPWEW